MDNKQKFEQARELIRNYAERTGVSIGNTKSEDRYLWTDALAVHALFDLYSTTGEEKYRREAEDLIALVHEHLGKHHPADPRKGWISGFPAEEGQLHPTAGGLRIGKRNPERGKDEAYHPQKEWEQDGQYFHYNTKWITALIKAGKVTGEESYFVHALELLLASARFIYRKGSAYAMYWKMDTELSRPLVSSMGAHDPLDGFLCAKQLEQNLPGKADKLKELTKKFTSMVERTNWFTPDPLGIGSLLLNTRTAARLKRQGTALPFGVRPQKLFRESLSGLQNFGATHHKEEPATRRLAFRECGLSMGVNAVAASSNELREAIPEVADIQKHTPLAKEIEEFWLKPENRKSPTWTDHLNINTVTLAASIIAGTKTLSSD